MDMYRSQQLWQQRPFTNDSSGPGNYFSHGVTHGGHPVGCAVALAAIDIIIQEKLCGKFRQSRDVLKTKFEKLMERRPQIGDVRGSGLMIGLEYVKDRQSKKPFTIKETNNLVVDLALLYLIVATHANNLLLLPPLISDETLADEIVSIIDRAMDKGLVNQLGLKTRMLAEFTASKLRP